VEGKVEGNLELEAKTRMGIKDGSAVVVMRIIEKIVGVIRQS
jgi:hypothetical protein